jgi:hypothetical protein
VFKVSRDNSIEVVDNQQFQTLLNKVDSKYGLLPDTKRIAKSTPRMFNSKHIEKKKIDFKIQLISNLSK